MNSNIHTKAVVKTQTVINTYSSKQTKTVANTEIVANTQKIQTLPQFMSTVSQVKPAASKHSIHKIQLFHMK